MRMSLEEAELAIKSVIDLLEKSISESDTANPVVEDSLEIAKSFYEDWFREVTLPSRLFLDEFMKEIDDLAEKRAKEYAEQEAAKKATEEVEPQRDNITTAYIGKVKCKDCGWEGSSDLRIKLSPNGKLEKDGALPAYAPFHNFRCPVCFKHNIDTSELNAIIGGNSYAYGDNNFKKNWLDSYKPDAEFIAKWETPYQKLADVICPHCSESLKEDIGFLYFGVFTDGMATMWCPKCNQKVDVRRTVTEDGDPPHKEVNYRVYK